MSERHGPGDAAPLLRWWSTGIGGAKIGWGTDGDFDRCVAEASQHLPPEQVKGFCANRHHQALGYWPSQHAAMDRAKGAKKKPRARGKGRRATSAEALDPALFDALFDALLDVAEAFNPHQPRDPFGRFMSLDATPHPDEATHLRPRRKTRVAAEDLRPGDVIHGGRHQIRAVVPHPTKGVIADVGNNALIKFKPGEQVEVHRQASTYRELPERGKAKVRQIRASQRGAGITPMSHDEIARDLELHAAMHLAAADDPPPSTSETSAEAMIAGQWSYQDIAAKIRDVLRTRNGNRGWFAIQDLTGDQVVYCDDLDSDDLWQASYTIDDAGAVTVGDPARVVRTYTAAPAGMPPDGDAPGQPGALDDDGELLAAGEAAWDGNKHPRSAAGEFAPGEGGEGDDGQGVKASSADTKKWQAQLNHLGYRITIDGKEGPETRNAIRQYQRDNGLPVTGQLDEATTKQMAEHPLRRKDVGKPPKPPKPPKPAPRTTGRPAGSQRTTVINVDATRKESTAVCEVGRIVEARGTNAAGGRVFRLQIIKAGVSRNGRRYTPAVLAEAAPLYEGARAYDHHRDRAEMTSSTINGLVGHLQDIHVNEHGLAGDLHLLPSATHASEVMQAALAAQEAGREPLAGVSHDVQAHFRTAREGGRQIVEATKIVGVNSVDLVAHPSAGGAVMRMVAGGTDADPLSEEEPVDLAQVMEAVRSADPADRAALLALLGEPAAAPEPGEPATEAAVAPPLFARDSVFGKQLLRLAVADAGLPDTVVEAVTAAMPERFTEADVTAHVGSLKATMAGLEKAGLVRELEGQGPTATVTQEAHDKKIKALDAFFAGDFANGYHSFKEAYVDFTGRRARALDFEDFNRTILTESFGDGRVGVRAAESMTSASWSLVLGDSITRRMIAEYGQPSLQTWRQIVSSIVPVNDFRTQRIDRVGGYGVLPTVNQGAPYQPLTSPTNEEVTYAINKRGGTEDLTLEMIANDDVRAISRIPQKLGLAASQTLYRFVWDLIATNPTLYDSVALFNSAHANTTSTALSGSALSATRQKLRTQAAYGDSYNILSLTPKTLLVNSALEELGWQLSRSAVALPSGAPLGAATNIPNIHEGLDLVVVDYWTASSTTQWYVAADPNLAPTIELGFYMGKQDPELFTQSDQSVGSMFNADKFTYKIRHIYSGAILDWRAFQRGNS